MPVPQIIVWIAGDSVLNNLYLHSSIVQTRSWQKSLPNPAEAIRYATLDSNIALLGALFINCAILIVAATTFHYSGNQQVAEINDYTSISDRSCLVWYSHLGRTKHRQYARSQSGCVKSSVAFRSNSPNYVYWKHSNYGSFCQSSMVAESLLWLVALLIAGLNIWLLSQTLAEIVS